MGAVRGGSAGAERVLAATGLDGPPPADADGVDADGVDAGGAAVA
jgi:hypothetical protein